MSLAGNKKHKIKKGTEIYLYSFIKTCALVISYKFKVILIQIMK